MSCFGFLKVMMFFFNGIIFLAGCGVLAVGVWVKVDNGVLLGLLDKLKDSSLGLDQIVNVGYLLIAVGGVLLIMGFLGCCGAVRESRCMLLTFFVIVLIVFIAEVAGAVIVLVFKPLTNDLITSLGNKAVASIKNEFGVKDDLTSLWNATMNGLKCCGFNNYTDFRVNITYPPACCQMWPCTLEKAKNATITGCFQKLERLIQENTTIIVAVGLGIAALEISAMVVSMFMYCKIGSK